MTKQTVGLDRRTLLPGVGITGASALIAGAQQGKKKTRRQQISTVPIAASYTKGIVETGSRRCGAT
jgi:hypothetical protein